MQLSDYRCIVFDKSDVSLAMQSHLKIEQTFILTSLPEHCRLLTRTVDLAESESLDGDRIWLGDFGVSAVNWWCSAHLLILHSSATP